jgi:hypothetical protein
LLAQADAGMMRKTESRPRERKEGRRILISARLTAKTSFIR